MSIEDLIAIIFGPSGALIGGWGLLEARKARAEAKEANHHADEANRLSEEANQISKQALGLSERLGRDQIELQRREVDLAHQAEQRSRSADIHVALAMKTSRGEFKFRVENRGPHHANQVAVSLHREDQTLNIGRATDLAPGRATEVSGHRGSFFGGALETELDDLLHSNAETAELRVTFADGNGPQVLRKRLITGPGSRFVDRPWTIEAWSADE